ncbi:ABC transporter ATP-binding protein [Facklamia miroungae]|uniref:ATP-binding cassette, subfamily B, tetracycline resistant protein n=1 Tax=Facklamia miroungae TaxID=120956 RepID=A0A1G7PW73_9LACT|nr:ABC transporter ATP-binding protein [Facklamia miroungae]NKZ28825.1 ABC transporter ATP-binding protein [Facklamia miroungae]SDF89630.1 ATP-binding cassette, subfamily B, tetracycline resistant protein [Facklamia miroungae]
MLSALFQFIKEHKIAYFIGGLLAIISGLLAIVPNYIIQLFIDAIVKQSLDAKALALYLAIFAVAAVSNYVVEASWLVILFGRSSLFTKQVRQKLFRRLAYLKLPFYENYRSGDLMTRMTSDIDSLGETLAYGFLIIISDGSWLIAILLVMFITISWELTLISIIPLIIFGVLIHFLGKEANKRYEASRDAVAKLSNEVLETVDGVRVIRAYGKKDLEQARFQERTRDVVKQSNVLNFLFGLFGPTARVFSGFSTGIGLTLGAYYVNQGQVSIGQLITFQIYLGMFNEVIWGMADLIAIYQQGQVSHRKIKEIEDADDLFGKEGDLPIDHIDQIDFQNFSFAYPSDQEPVIQTVNFSLKAGQTLGIVGKTGSGKSTLVRQLLRQYPIVKPEALKINGHSIVDYQSEQLAGLIGYVPQDHVLFSRSVRDNILFGKADATEEELNQAIEAADFTKDINHMSRGLETLIGEKGVAISGGQKQRVAIARALIRQPELLIMDDSLSAVDAKTEKAIIKNIQAAREGQTNIIITHRLSAVSHADLILVLEEGCIIERGKPDELLANKGWYYQQYLNQQTEEGSNGNT